MHLTSSPAENTTTGKQRLLRSYQIKGVRFLHHSTAALLADEMGLGKTVQTATALSLNASSPGNRVGP